MAIVLAHPASWDAVVEAAVGVPASGSVDQYPWDAHLPVTAEAYSVLCLRSWVRAVAGSALDW